MRIKKRHDRNRSHRLIFRIDGDGNVVCTKDKLSVGYALELGDEKAAEGCGQSSMTKVISGKAKCG